MAGRRFHVQMPSRGGSVQRHHECRQRLHRPLCHLHTHASGLATPASSAEEGRRKCNIRHRDFVSSSFPYQIVLS